MFFALNFQGKVIWGCAGPLEIFIHQCGIIHNAKKKLMTAHTYTHRDSFTKPGYSISWEPIYTKHRTQHRQREKAENWITASPSFPLLFFSFPPLSSLHVRQRGSFCSLLRDRLIQLCTPKEERNDWVRREEGN